MNIIALMAVLALLLSASFVFAYIWAASRGQFDDLETPALRMLKNDSIKIQKSERTNNENRSS